MLPPSRPGVDRFKIFIGAANAAPKQPAACAETAAGDDSDANDLAACAAVTELDLATTCEAITTDSGADAADAKACTYVAAAGPAIQADGTSSLDAVTARFNEDALDDLYVVFADGTNRLFLGNAARPSGFDELLTGDAVEGIGFLGGMNTKGDRGGRVIVADFNSDTHRPGPTGRRIFALQLTPYM